LRQLNGLLGDRARDWRAAIIEALALIEAGIDFSDEGDVPAELIAPALEKIRRLLGESRKCLRHRGGVNACATGSRRDIGTAERRQVDADQSAGAARVAIVSPHAAPRATSSRCSSISTAIR